MRVEIKWAVIAAVALFVILLAEKLFGLQTAEKYGTWVLVDLILGFLLFIIVYLMVTREKREADLGGVMSWKQGFWAAAIMTVIFIPISTLLVYIFLKFINPEAASILMAKGGDISGKDAINNYLYLHLINAVFGGLLFSLIFPLFTRKSA
jgi:hypothetical protein